jgi:hypothetical protein
MSLKSSNIAFRSLKVHVCDSEAEEELKVHVAEEFKVHVSKELKVHVSKELKVDVCECSKVHQVIRIDLRILRYMPLL